MRQFMKSNMVPVRVLALLLAFFLCAAPAAAVGETGGDAAASIETAAESDPPAAAEGEDKSKPVQQSGSGVDVHGTDAVQAMAGPSDYSADAKAALLLELNSDTMVYAQNPDERLYPASLTKLMTFLVAIENGNINDRITVSETALKGLDPAGSSAGLEAGEIFSLHDLLYCLMLASANDACPVIAEYVAGSEAAFVEMMNQRAAELGCTGTHFVNTHGLHDDNHYTTARDVAKIFRAVLNFDLFCEIYSTDIYTVPATNKHEARTLSTTNYLIGTSATHDYYDNRVIGGKTGFTTPAGRCVACTAEENGLFYLCIILGAKNVENEEGTVVQFGSFIEASKLLDFGFDQFQFARVLSPLAPVAQYPVKMAMSSVVVTPDVEVSALLPKDYDAALLRSECVLDSTDGLEAPLEAGEKVGVIRQYYDSLCIGQANLITVTAIARQAVAAQTAQAVNSISSSPWKIPLLIFTGLLVLFLLLALRSALVRRARKKRRAQKRGRR